jgi:integrase
VRRIRKNGLPKYCSWNRDREGGRFVRFRHGIDVYLKGALFSEAWWKQYADAMQGVAPDRSTVPAPTRVARDSMDDLVRAYYRAPQFRDLAASTQANRRNILTAFCKDHGKLPVKALQRRHVVDIIGARADTPMAATNLLKCLRYVLAFAVDSGVIETNPAVGVKGYRSKSEGVHTWTEDEVAAFLARHPAGTMAHAAMILMLYTGQRKSDAVRMGRQNIRGDMISVRQLKTGEPLMIQLHPVLKRVLDRLPKKNLTFLTTSRGMPFSKNGFGNWMRDRCDEAGLPQCTAHGLRKLCTVRLVEAGCTNEQIRAVTGHRSDSSLRPYTRKADQAKLARQAMAVQIEAERTKSDAELSSGPILLDKAVSK